MKGKKKGVAVLLCLVLIVVMISGCNVPGEKDKKETVKKETVKKETEDGAEKIENYDSLESKGTLRRISELLYRDSEEYPEVTIEKQVLVDQNRILITALEYISDPIKGEGIMLSVENNTGSAIIVKTNSVIVNNYQFLGSFEEEVAPGETLNKIMEFSGNELEQASIGEVGQIEIGFAVCDIEEDEYGSQAELFTTERITIQTSAYATMDNTPVSEGVEVYNDNGVRIVGLYAYEAMGKDVMFCVENNSERKIRISMQKAGINGIAMDQCFGSEVFAGKKYVGEIDFYADSWEESKITKLEDVEVQFAIYDDETRDEVGFSDMIKLDIE